MAYEFNKEQVLEAIKGSYGIVSQIARSLGCTWNTAQTYTNRWAETRQAYQDENERSLDHTEGKMLEAIKNSDGPMIRFHLSTKGKRRGYVTGTQLTGEDGGTIKIQVVGFDAKRV